MVFPAVVAVTKANGLEAIKSVNSKTNLPVDTYLPDKMIRQYAALLFSKFQNLHHGPEWW